ncbi:unnamed protein product [Protopolystoma xenopodis]|uniref:Uncharacterized protein n=1 Tax=Protopolystoma xenopodis TaxID=117903 RepID=A0A448WBF2_9PLAT|nr:unnamed protein product [Protopolystoma xenopodis]
MTNQLIYSLDQDYGERQAKRARLAESCAEADAWLEDEEVENGFNFKEVESETTERKKTETNHTSDDDTVALVKTPNTSLESYEPREGQAEFKPIKPGYLIRANIFVEELDEEDFPQVETIDGDMEAKEGDQEILSIQMNSPESGMTALRHRNLCSPRLVLKIAWLDGSNRESANQILFYLINRLK